MNETDILGTGSLRWSMKISMTLKITPKWVTNLKKISLHLTMTRLGKQIPNIIIISFYVFFDLDDEKALLLKQILSSLYDKRHV